MSIIFGELSGYSTSVSSLVLCFVGLTRSTISIICRASQVKIVHNLWVATRSFPLIYCWSMYVRTWIVIFSRASDSEYSRYNFGFSSVIYVCLFWSPRQWIMCFVDPEFFGICSGSFSIYVWTPHSAFFRYFVWYHTVNYSDIFFFSDVSWWDISIFFGDRRWMLWQVCNMKLLIIFGVCSCRVFRDGVGCLTISTFKFCDVLPVNFLVIAPCILLTNISIFVGCSQWFLFLLRHIALRVWIITTFCCVGHCEFSPYYIQSFKVKCPHFSIRITEK